MKNKYFWSTLILFMMCIMPVGVLQAQKLPFQGKLFENGVPVIESSTFAFGIEKQKPNENSIFGNFYYLGNTMQKFKSLTEIYGAYQNYLAPVSTPKHKIEFDQILAAVFCPGPYYYYILDSPTLTFDFTSSAFVDFFGFDIAQQSLNNFIDVIHPDDFDFFLKCENYVADFLQTKITPDKVTSYKISYCLRERVKDGSYKLFLIQTITVSATQEGSLLKVLGIHSDISHITMVNNHKLSLTGLNGEPSYIGIDMMQSSPVVPVSTFSNRELEVIRYLMNGLTAKEIAKQMYISEETVISHKKNAMVKTESKNSIQLVAHCLKNGLV